MPRGKYVNHKGRSRNFTNPEELQRQDESDDSSNEGATSSHFKSKNHTDNRYGKRTESDDSEESDASEDDRDAKKGVSSLIEIENPNRVVKKAAQKVSSLTIDDDVPAKPQELSRREREVIEKQKAKLRYEKLHAEGKTSQAKADLARLAIIKQQRAEAAAKREAEKKEREKKEATKG